jgi:hypothetical protein
MDLQVRDVIESKTVFERTLNQRLVMKTLF